MKLTDSKIRAAKPKERMYRITDGRGLMLQIDPNGVKSWRFRYRFRKKENMISLGRYPERSLKDAREDHFELRRLLAAGTDPAELRRAEKEERERVASGVDLFETIAREWYEMKHAKEVSEGHAKTSLRRLELNVFPWLGQVSINDITPPQVLAVLRRIETRGALETAHRVKSICGQVFRYAVATGRAERDPSTDLRGVLPNAGKNHLAALTEPKEVAKLLRAIDEYEGSDVVRCALRFAYLTFVRPGELRHAEWQEIDFQAAQWNIPGHKMKTKAPHVVPLSRQALDVLREVSPITGDDRYIFPSVRSGQRAMSDNTVNAAIRRLGYTREEMTGHGFRAMARTLLDEVLQVPPAIIEQQLAHSVRDPLGRAYNRTSHLKQRQEMMQLWADYLDGLKQGAKVLPLRNQNAAG